MALDEVARRYLTSQSRGRLATVAPNGAPQNKPVGYAYNAVLGTVDIAGIDMEKSAKYRNVGVNPNVALVVDDAVAEGAAGMRFLEIRGPAERVSVERPSGSKLSRQIIRIHPRRVISLNIDPDRPGFQTADLDLAAGESEGGRPSLGLDGDAATGAHQAAAGLVAELQAGWDEHDADITNRHFAEDIVWGSPFGAALQGYEPLHAIHVRLKQRSRGGDATRFEVVNVLSLAPNVAVAQIRRIALDSGGNPIDPTAEAATAFSEMALYVLVRRGRTWWLAAGQNTLERPTPD